MYQFTFEETPEHVFKCSLDGITCSIRIYFTEYDDVISGIVQDGANGKWFIDIESSRFDVKGIALVCGVNLLDPYAIMDIGQLWIVSSTDDDEDPNSYPMNAKYKLLYLTKEEAYPDESL